MTPFPRRTVWSALGIVALAGCAPQPRLTVPSAVLSADWRPTVPVAAAPSAGEIGLGSPELRALIATALRQSPALLGAEARIDQARALLKRARGAMLPVVSASAQPSLGQSRPGGPLDFSGSFVSLDASLSLDLGGGRRAAGRSARDRLRAASFDRDAAMLTISTEIARTFVTRAALSARLALLDRSIVQAEDLERIIRYRQHEGEGTLVDVGFQQIRLMQLRAERERLSQALHQTRTALALLVGEESPIFASSPADLDTLGLAPTRLPAPAELVVVRPDVRAAEARLRAAGGDVSEARAAFFPQIELALGRSSQAALGTPLLSSITLAGSVLAPIFNRGQLRADLDFASAKQREAAQLYRQAILSAFSEVDDARSAFSHADARLALLEGIVEKAELTARLARLQYLEGTADLRQLLDAQDFVISAEDACVVGRQERIEATIAIFRAASSGQTAGRT